MIVESRPCVQTAGNCGGLLGIMTCGSPHGAAPHAGGTAQKPDTPKKVIRISFPAPTARGVFVCVCVCVCPRGARCDTQNCDGKMDLACKNIWRKWERVVATRGIDCGLVETVTERPAGM
jgi:hypothetical protein